MTVLVVVIIIIIIIDLIMCFFLSPGTTLLA